MARNDYSLTLRLRHPDLDPREITQRLGVEPQHSWRAGEPRRTETGDDGVYRETFWLGLLPSPFAPLGGAPLPSGLERADAIAGHLSDRFVEPQATLFFVLLKMRRDIDFWRSFLRGQGTIECHLQVHRAARFHLALSPDLLRIFVDLGIAFSIDVDTDLAVAA